MEGMPESPYTIPFLIQLDSPSKCHQSMRMACCMPCFTPVSGLNPCRTPSRGQKGINNKTQHLSV